MSSGDVPPPLRDPCRGGDGRAWGRIAGPCPGVTRAAMGCGWRDMRQTACKPGSVLMVAHDGRPFIWGVRHRTPQRDRPGRLRGSSFRPRKRGTAAPIWSCSRWGLPCRPCCQVRGALLPHPFTLTHARMGGLLSVALSLGSPPPDVIRHRASVEPGLSSPRLLEGRPSSRLARLQCGPATGVPSSAQRRRHGILNSLSLGGSDYLP
jgi:hypothetical protein